MGQKSAARNDGGKTSWHHAHDLKLKRQPNDKQTGLEGKWVEVGLTRCSFSLSLVSVEQSHV